MSAQAPRALAHRASGEPKWTLYRSPDDDSAHTEVRDAATGEPRAFAVPRECALDSCCHPYAHLPTAQTPRVPVGWRS